MGMATYILTDEEGHNLLVSTSRQACINAALHKHNRLAEHHIYKTSLAGEYDSCEIITIYDYEGTGLAWDYYIEYWEVI